MSFIFPVPIYLRYKHSFLQDLNLSALFSSFSSLSRRYSGVDSETDARIQNVMRTEFKRATCITVAHRINTIMDSTYILVMDNGKVAEFDSPASLLSKGGLFKELVDAWEKEHK